MKSKFVLWGSNAQDEKLMIAAALRADDNKVDIYTFPEAVATEEFYQKMMKEWRDTAATIDLPEHTYIERELTISDSLLPDDLKVERTDVVNRAQTEWHFLVLSAKLHRSYEEQLAELQGRVQKLENFEQSTWDSLREFWVKIQDQVKQRHLLREHGDTLRDNTNLLFEEMKKLRSIMDAEFDSLSQEAFNKLSSAISEVEEKVAGGGRLNIAFEELKKLQQHYKEASLNKDHRNKLWDKLNAAFQTVKGKHPKSNGEQGGSWLQRLQHRYDGLLQAIARMQTSIRHDRNDLDYEHHRIATTSGQLEAQIRQAKLKMIEERVVSKEEKLADMAKTKAELVAQIAIAKERDLRRLAEEAAKAKFANKAKASAQAMEPVAEKLEKAAHEISEGKAKPKAGPKKEESILDAVTATLGESLGGVMDTMKAMASVIAEKVEDAIEDIKVDLEERTKETPKAAAPPAPENGKKEGGLAKETTEAVKTKTKKAPKAAAAPAPENGKGDYLVEEAAEIAAAVDEAVLEAK